MQINADSGIIIINRPALSERFAESYIFTRLEKHPATITFFTAEGKKIITPHLNIKSLIEFIPNSELQFIDRNSIDRLKKELALLKTASGEYSSAKPLLEERILRISTALDHLANDEIFYRNTWRSKAEYEKAIADQELEIKARREAAETAQMRLADEKLNAAIDAMKARRSMEEAQRVAAEKAKQAAEELASEEERKRKLLEKKAADEQFRAERWRLELKSPPVFSSDRFIVENFERFANELSTVLDERLASNQPRVSFQAVFDGLDLRPKAEIGRIGDFSVAIHRSNGDSDVAVLSISESEFVLAVAVVAVSTAGLVDSSFLGELTSRVCRTSSSIALKDLQLQTAASILRSKVHKSASAHWSFSDGRVPSRVGQSDLVLSHQRGFFWKKNGLEDMLVFFIW